MGSVNWKKEGGSHLYDMLVIGGGPGGYTAAMYGARAGLDTLVLEKMSAGGQMALTAQIDNYPGFEEGIEGFALGEKMQKGAERFGVKTEFAEVHKLTLDGKIKTAETGKRTFIGKTIVFATGASPRKLELPGEKELTGRGVSYCAACDGMFYKGKTVVVVGGGNSAAADALILSRIARKVIVVHRRDALRATKIYQEALFRAENVTFCWDSVVTELLRGDVLHGDGLYGDKFQGAKLKNRKTGEETIIASDGIFVSVGRRPATELAENQLELDGDGYIIADESTRTTIPGVFAAGDVRKKVLRQVVTAVADGAVAAHYAEEYLAGLE